MRVLGWMQEMDETQTRHSASLSRSAEVVVIVDGKSDLHLTSKNGRYSIVPLGTQYNVKCAKNAGDRNRTRGMLDNMLDYLDKYGVETTLQRLDAPIGLVVWDEETRELSVARDKVGKLSLYYGWSGRTFYFATRLADIVRCHGLGGRVDHKSLALFLRYNYVPAPLTIYSGVFKLPAAAMLTVDLAHGLQATSEPKIYWNPYRRSHQPSSHENIVDEQELIRCCEQLILEAVARRLDSGSVGTFLSGGIDSTLVTAVAQSLCANPVKTYTIGFDDQTYNEAVAAKQIAEFLGTDHTELYISAEEAMAVIPRLPEIYQEPFSDSSQIATVILSKLAATHSSVVLSGDGGDEVFGGYNRHVWVPKIWSTIAKYPVSLRRIGSRFIHSLPPRTWDRLYSWLHWALPPSLHVKAAGAKLHKLATVLDASSPEDIYLRLTSHWQKPTDVVVTPSGGQLSCELLYNGLEEVQGDLSRRMMYLDLRTYLPEDVLVKVGRAAAFSGLEVRSPFLDYSVIEFSASLPTDMLIRNNQGKWILRQILNKYIPSELMNRPKWGFGVPLDQWLRGPLRDWAEALLDAKRLSEDGLFDPAPIRRLWNEHLTGKADWQHHIWDILMFQLWFDTVHKECTRKRPGSPRGYEEASL